MKKTRIVLAALAAVVALTVVSCDALKAVAETIDALYAINGKVVNVKASTTAANDFVSSKTGSTATLVGSTITFTNTATSTAYTATVGSDGRYSISDVPNGKYNITASNSAWAFIPTTSFVVSSSTTTAPNILAFPIAEAGSLTVAMQWENTATDMDLHMKYGTLDTSDTVNHLYWVLPTKTGTNFTASLDRDVTGLALTSGKPLVETITLTADGSGTIISPFDASYSSADLVGINNTFRFYIDAYGKASGTTGIPASTTTAAVTGAGATVHVFQGAEHLGSYYAPFNTAERTIRVLKVAFDGTASNNYTVFTDIQSTGNGVFRSLGLPQIGLPVVSIE